MKSERNARSSSGSRCETEKDKPDEQEKSDESQESASENEGDNNNNEDEEREEGEICEDYPSQSGEVIEKSKHYKKKKRRRRKREMTLKSDQSQQIEEDDEDDEMAKINQESIGELFNFVYQLFPIINSCFLLSFNEQTQTFLFLRSGESLDWSETTTRRFWRRQYRRWNNQ